MSNVYFRTEVEEYIIDALLHNKFIASALEGYADSFTTCVLKDVDKRVIDQFPGLQFSLAFVGLAPTQLASRTNDFCAKEIDEQYARLAEEQSGLSVLLDKRRNMLQQIGGFDRQLKPAFRRLYKDVFQQAQVDVGVEDRLPAYLRWNRRKLTRNAIPSVDQASAILHLLERRFSLGAHLCVIDERLSSAFFPNQKYDTDFVLVMGSWAENMMCMTFDEWSEKLLKELYT